ncbi:MAG TPA: sulfatase [Blastocatellia bacterium]|nr:sulfatase [Blastocatellia bacterium]
MSVTGTGVVPIDQPKDRIDQSSRTEKNEGLLGYVGSFAMAGGCAFLLLGLIELLDLNLLSPDVFESASERLGLSAYASMSVLVGAVVGFVVGFVFYVGSLSSLRLARALARGREPGLLMRLAAWFGISAVAAFLLNQIPSVNRYVIGQIREAEKYASLREFLLNHERSTSYLILMVMVLACSALWLITRALPRLHWMIRCAWLAALAVLMSVFYFIDSRVEVQLYEYTLHRTMYLSNTALAMAFVAGLYHSSEGVRSFWARASSPRKNAFALIAAALFLAGFAYTVYNFGSDNNLRNATFYRSTQAKQSFKLAWWALDFDRDGYSALLGGGDSDDFSRGINPDQLEVPGDGSDNNSIGGDVTASDVEGWLAEHRSLRRPPAGAARRYNIVYFFVDTVRADHLSAYGYHRKTSPNIDRLPATVFENAFSPSPRTSEAVPKFMQSSYWDARIESWPQVLKRNGYNTMLFPGRRSWDRYKNWMPVVREAQGKHLEQNIDVAIRTLSNAPQDAPFCAYIYVPDPHRPYIKHDDFYYGETTADVYDGELAYTDYHLGRFFDWMEQSQRMKDTIVVIMSDHGESLGERGVFRHSTQLYNEQVRVPMIVYVPGMEPRRVADYVSTVDLGSTILDLVGIDYPKEYLGVSLAPLMRGEQFTRPPIYGEQTLEEYSPYVRLDQQVHPLSKKYMVITQDGFKLIFNRNFYSFEMYDLNGDPAESRNLFDKMPEKAENLKQLLGRFVDVVTASRPPEADEGRYSKAGGIDGDKVED